LKIYIEESGDLGFSSKSTGFFVIGAIITPDDICFGRCFKKIRGTLGKKKRDIPELKCYNSNITIKRRVYDCLSHCDIKIGYALLRKNQVYTRLKTEQSKLYNYIIGNLILKILESHQIDESIHLVIDKSQYNFSREHFNDYLADKFLFNGYYELANSDKLQISHVDSRNCHGIQAADFVTGCIFRTYRDNNDSDYVKYFKEKTVIALDYFNGRIK
jgi:hypothetical protein